MSLASSSIPSATVHLGLKAGRTRADLGEVHSIVTLVRAGASGKGDRRIECFGHQRGDVANLDDVLVAADIERLVVHIVARGLENSEERASDVLGMHQRSPRAAVALQPNLAAGERNAGEVVDDDVGAQSGEDPYAVAFRRYVGLKSSSASSESPASARTLLSPYGVTGLNGASSAHGASVVAAP